MTDSPTDRRRRRREDLFRPLIGALAAAIIVVAVLSWGLLHFAGEANRAAHDAGVAAQAALRNTRRITVVEHNACARLQRVRTAVNRNGAIIFVVLGAVSGNVQKAGHTANAREYRILGSLPRYDPTVNCDAAADPAFKQRDSIPYTRLPRDTFRELLPDSVLDRILGDTP